MHKLHTALNPPTHAHLLPRTHTSHSHTPPPTHTSLQTTGTECPALAQLTNGQISYASDTTADFEIGTEATHTCNFGYTLSNNNVVLTCTQANGNDLIGVWDVPSPTCNCEF